MSTNWSQENHAHSPRMESESERRVRGPEYTAPPPTARLACAWTNQSDAETPPARRLTRWKAWFIGMEGTLAAAAGGAIFYSLDVASFGILACAVTAGGIVAAFGLGHYLFWGAYGGGGGVRVEQPVRDQPPARKPATQSAPASPREGSMLASQGRGCDS